MQTPKLHIKFCWIAKRAMFICTGFPQLDAKSAGHVGELLRQSGSQRRRAGSQVSKFCSSPPRASGERVQQDARANEPGKPGAPDDGDDWYARELDEYASSAPARVNMRGVFLFIAFNVLIVAKYAYHITLTWLELDYNNFEQNIKPIRLGAGDGQQAFRFLCVITNCTRLSADGRAHLEDPTPPLQYSSDDETLVRHRLADDLKHLPIFTLCHPNLLFFFSPVAELGQLGVMVFCYVGLLIICTSLGFTVQQIFTRANAESLMFIVAPHVTLQLMCIQLEKMRRQFADSLENYRALVPNKVCYPRRDSRTSAGLNQQPLVKSAGGGEGFLASSPGGPILSSTGDLRHKLHQYRRQFKEYKLQESDNSELIQADGQEFVSDCLPAVRSGWWHKQIAHLYFNSFFWFIWIACVPTAILSLSVITYAIHNLHARLEAFDKFMAAEGCAIWHERDGQSIGLARLNVGWSLWDIIETGPPIVCALYITIVVSTLTFAIMSELNCWLLEIQHNLQLLRELVHLQHSCAFLQDTRPRHGHTIERRELIPAGTDKSGMSIMRDLFIRHTHIKFFFIRTTPLDGDQMHPEKPRALQVELARQEFALALLQRAQSRRSLLVELAEKIYLNHRLFVRLIDMYSTNTVATILLQQIAAYGSTLTAVLLTKITSDMTQYARTMIVLTLSCVFTFTTLISNFHAEARKLQPLFWSLIAELAHTRDVELLHLRHVLIKKTVHVDREGGLAMCAFSFRVTYTNVIQVIAWTSTIFVLTFR